MKKLLTIVLCMIALSSCTEDKLSDKEKTLQIDRFIEAHNINESLLNRTLTNEQYIDSLEKCSSQGNGFCIAHLGGAYYNKKEYEKAHLFFIAAYEDTKTFDNLPPPSAFASEFLGHMYYFGQGVLQDYDKAITYYKAAAKYGFRNSAYMISRATVMKAYNSRNSKHMYSASKTAYAWLKVAQSLPETEDCSNKHLTTILESFDKASYFQSLRDGANKLAKEICKDTAKCIE